MSNHSCCIYRSKDPVRNFRIKVSLEKATGQSTSKNKNQLNQLLKNQLNSENREEVVINWQTKIFSKREYIKYSNPEYLPTTILGEHYKEECLKLKERNYQPGRIFTYIDSDPYQFADEIECEVSSASKDDIPAYLQKPKSHLKKRRPMIGNAKSIESIIPRKNIVEYDPDSEESRSVTSKIIPFHTMYIMGDLSNDNEINKDRVLCCIKIDANGSIVMKPDFSSTSYLIHTYGKSRETYEYFLEHVSSKVSTENLMREQRLHKELYMRHSDYINNLVGNIFKMPAPGVMKVHVFGEIMSVKNFDYDDLHVYYQLELPRNWHIDPSAPISGFTQTSRTKIEGKDEVAYFSHPFEYDLYYKNDEINDQHKDLLPKMPKLLFEVASYDSWNRYRTEGYAWSQIPARTTLSDENLICWRPRGDSIIYELRRFFIGGSPELEDISYISTPPDHNDTILSRMGFRTTTTGTLNVRLNVIFQSQVFLDKKSSTKNHNQLLDRMGNYSNLNDLIGVLEQFNMARTKMINAREDSKRILEE